MTLATQPGSRIRGVAEVSTDEPLVLSLYLSLDPSTYGIPKQRNAEIESSIDDARAQLAAAGLSHGGADELDADIDRVHRYLADELDTSGGVQAVVVFSCSRAELF